MTALTLQDPEVQKALEHFIGHARKCAQTEYKPGTRNILGVAAMCTVFPCMLTVGEALARRKKEHPGGKTGAMECFVRPDGKYECSQTYEWDVAPPPEKEDKSKYCTVRYLLSLRSSLGVKTYQGDDPKKGYITRYSNDRCDRTEDIWQWLFRQRKPGAGKE